MTAKKAVKETRAAAQKRIFAQQQERIGKLLHENEMQQETIQKLKETVNKWGTLLNRKNEIPGVAIAGAGSNAQQVGGHHYKNMAIQPWDYLTANNIPYMEGTIIVYLTRWRDKGGIQDLQKAKHTLEKLIELESSKKLNAERRQQAHQAVEQAFSDQPVRGALG